MRKLTSKLIIAATLVVATFGTYGTAYAAPPKGLSVTGSTSESTQAADGWKKSKGDWYYYQDGKTVTGWKEIDGKWYFFGKSGKMEKDAYRQGYYLTKDGSWDGKAKVKGWIKTDNGWWKFQLAGKDAYVKNTWKMINGKWYYFQEEGYMEDTCFVQGWWLGKSGAMTDFARCSWHTDKKGRWYGNKSGWYAKGTTYIIDGSPCNFDKNGYEIHK